MTITETPPQDPGPGGTSRRRVTVRTTIAVLVVGVVGVLIALALTWGSATTPAGSRVPDGPPVAVAAPGQIVPVRVSVPSIAADSSLVSLGINPDHTVAVPPLSQPMQAAWFNGSPTPGQLGPSVVLGHVNGNGKRGIFADLDKVRPGAQVVIDRSDGQTAVFTVSRVDLVPKKGFPTAQVYGDTRGPELRLITCGGDLDRKRHNYLSNVVVYATLTQIHKT